MIYFILDKANDYVKIGYSHDPSKRLKQLQTGNSTSLEMLVVIPGMITEERALHETFREYRVRGEWYRYEGMLVVYIDSLLTIDFETVSGYNFGKANNDKVSSRLLETEPISSYINIDSKVSLPSEDRDKTFVISLMFICALFVISAMFIAVKK